ncbi:MAG: ABC transporter ATP-binding protein [Candidatus Oxydemutatoraceae bacterium WSBS_2016_MAG_OTU14]
MSDQFFSIQNIEVVYNQVILALRGVSLELPKGKVVCLLGANGAGKTTTLKACSSLLEAERGMITKGKITYLGQDISKIEPYELVSQGVVQVLEGRHCFSNLTVEENLMTGGFIRKTATRKEIRQDIEKIYDYFPRIRDRRKTLAGFTSGGEQQMIAIGRALLAKPKLILLDEPSMGLAPQFVEEVFEIVKTLNEVEKVSFLIAEQNAMVALRYADYGYIIENGHVVLKGDAENMLHREDVKELYMGTTEGADRINFKEVKYYHRRRPAFF